MLIVAKEKYIVRGRPKPRATGKVPQRVNSYYVRIQIPGQELHYGKLITL